MDGITRDADGGRTDRRHKDWEMGTLCCWVKLGSIYIYIIYYIIIIFIGISIYMHCNIDGSLFWVGNIVKLKIVISCTILHKCS